MPTMFQSLTEPQRKLVFSWRKPKHYTNHNPSISAYQPFQNRRAPHENSLSKHIHPLGIIIVNAHTILLSFQTMDADSCHFIIEKANASHHHLAELISQTMEKSAAARGTGIAKRSPDTIIHYMEAGQAMIATHEDGRWAGFCYLALWDNGKFVSTSGLIVAEEFREHGIAKKLKVAVFDHCIENYPNASLVGITTSLAVMKINTALGFHPTAFCEMPQQPEFWKGCEACVNHDILQRTKGKFCLCTAMRYDKPTQAEKLAVAV